MEFLTSPLFGAVSVLSLLTMLVILLGLIRVCRRHNASPMGCLCGKSACFPNAGTVVADMMDTPLWRLRSIEVRKRGILQQLLNYGSLVLHRGELPTIVRVPRPHEAHAVVIPHVQGMQPALEKNRGSGAPASAISPVSVPTTVS